MKRTVFCGLTIACLVAASGCKDSMPSLVMKENNLKNEMADLMSRVTDEESAQFITKTYSDKMKTKWDDFKDKRDAYFKGQDLEGWFRQVKENAEGKVKVGKIEVVIRKTTTGREVESVTKNDDTRAIVDMLNAVPDMTASELRVRAELERIKGLIAPLIQQKQEELRTPQDPFPKVDPKQFWPSLAKFDEEWSFTK